ncbi:adapter molecule Crk-like isoform X1 [Pecten maximus]|uniref:adapter molecule Crk-like isoform X1 n=1 Tax=Pecten maximus TaxID=6579 RepID=UPI0014590CBF|nr:adapter molecule Crk-like isoform X1 [Pecten maximus]
MAEFDPDDKYSWYFGPLNREEANEILQPTQSSGEFLVRDSQSIKGDFVLCVKEDNKVSHYIINKIAVGNTTRFRIGDQEFPDIPNLLSFYKTHYLDTTSLIKPATRLKVITKFDFGGNDPEDLPFRKGEVLEVISKDEKDWWTCRNSHNRVGQIPVPYVVKFDGEMSEHLLDLNGPEPSHTQGYMSPANQVNQPIQVGQNNMGNVHGPPPGSPPPTTPAPPPVKLPAMAIVIQPRIPNLYDKTQLKLEKGEIVTVTKMNKNGQWEGEIQGRKGIFPFTHVKFIDQDGTGT